MRDADIASQRYILESVEEALTWPPPERDARLGERFGHDPALFVEIRDLLRAAINADQSLPTALPMAVAVGADAPPPEMLGPYRVGELLGSGGMGRVYRADRADGVFTQTVAIKLVRQMLMPPAVAEQFARERQILANLQHPHISRLLDGGVSAGGHSYIVMELLVGRPITQYAADEKLSLQPTLHLFLKVCAAVAYAHARMVVHADIKPNNIIVDGDGNPKLMDFGVARLVAAGGGADAADRPIGLTYDYSSPARRRGDAATTSDDVFSLGVLLADLMAHCGAPSADLLSVMDRARAADPETRYGSVDALSEDLQRWLAGLPVLAHGTQWQYLAGKFLERNRLVTGVVCAAILLLLCAAVALGVSYVRAERARLLAEERFSALRALAHFALFDVYDRLESMPRALALRRDITDQAQHYLDQLAADPSASTELRLEVIEGLRRLAQVQAAPGSASLGQVTKARANLDYAQTLVTALPEVAATRTARAMVSARLKLQRAVIAHSIDLDFVTAERELSECRALCDQVLLATPTDLPALMLKREWAVEMAAVLQWQGQYSRSRKIAIEALNLEIPGIPSTDRTATLQRSRLLDIFAEGTFYGGDVAASEAPYREELAMLERLAATAPQDAYIARRVARAGWALGSTLIELQRAEEAANILATARQRYELLVLLEPDDQDLARGLDITVNAYASTLVALRRFNEALPALSRSVEFRKRLAAQDPQNPSLVRDQAIAIVALADGLAESGATSAACERYAEAAAVFERVRVSGRLPKLDRDFGLQRLRQGSARYCSG